MSLRKASLLVLMLLVLIAATACGPNPTATPSPTDTAVPTEEATVEATEEPVAQEATEEATVEATETPTEEATAEATEAAALPDLEGRTIRVAVENAYPPFNSINTETGEAEGWDYDAVNAICERLNCVPEFVQTSWDGMLVAIANGEFDVAADGITITAEREESVDFSIGYLSVDQSILVRADETRFETTQDLIDDTTITVGTQTGTTNYDVGIETFGEERVRAYDLFPVAVQALINGDVDAVIMDNTAGLGYVGANPDLVKIIGTSLSSDPLGFAFPPGSDLVAPFNAALESMMADGSLEEINRRWFVPTEEPAAEATTEATEAAALPDLEGRTIRVAVENAYPPFNSINTETGEAEGWDYDAVNAICERLNCVPEFVQTSWDGMLVAIANGEFDVAADGITITAEREESVDFSIGYLSVDQSILVRADETRFETTQDLIDDTTITVGTQTGTTNYDVGIETFGEERVRAYDLFPVAVQALINGDVDAVIMDNTAGLGYVGANPDLVKIIGTSLSSDPLGFAFPPGSDLVAPFNAALESMMADGSLEEINRRWFVPTEEPAAEATTEATEAATAEATP